MNTATISTGVQHQRKIHYVDEAIQKTLLVGLVLLEVALAAGLAWLMWHRLNAIVEDNLYLIHLAEARPILTQLLIEAARLLGVFVAVNVAALVLVDILWRRYVHSVLTSFAQSMAKTRALDFTPDVPLRSHHQLLDLTAAQREQDRQRLTAVRAQVHQLAKAASAESVGVAAALATLDATLPKGRESRPERRVSTR